MTEDPEQPEFESRDVQKLLLKSFFVVTFCYTAFLIGMVFIGAVVFNDAFMAMGNLDQEAFQQKLNEEPDALFPRARNLPFVAIAVLLSAALGWLIVKLAPFSYMSHAMFLAILVAVTSFIFATGDQTPAAIQTLAMIMVAAGPIAIYAGARMSVGASPLPGDQQNA